MYDSYDKIRPKEFKTMIGSVGFIAAAVAITAFSWSAERAYITVGLTRLRLFCMAFGLLAVAMVMWATIAVFDQTALTRNLMLVSDTLLLLGTACMALLLIDEYSVLVLSLLGGVIAMLVAFRAYIQPPTAYVHDGLLFFNLEGGSRLFIVGLFALVWLPAMMVVANRVANDPLLTARRYSLQMYFVLLVALMGLFSKARRPGAIICLFALIVLVFAVITVFNIVLQRAHQAVPVERSRRGAKRAVK